MSVLHAVAKGSPVRPLDIEASIKLQKAQVDAWMKRALSEGRVAKLTRPVRYVLAPTIPQQGTLFDEIN